MTDSRSLLEKLPIEIFGEIEKNLFNSDQARLASTCKTYYNKHKIDHFTNNIHIFYNAKIRDKCQNAQQLLEHIVRGEQDKAEAMLCSDPGLLLEKRTVKDYSRRQIKGTAFQIALGADDTEMYQMIKPYFNQLANGHHLASQQFHEQFPSGIQPTSSTYDFKILVDAISKEQFVNDQVSKETEEVINQFRMYFTTPHLIESGRHFDMQIYLKAIDTYITNFKEIKTWKQRSLYCRQVIGYLQRLFSTCWAQALSQGLFEIAEENKYLTRTLMLLDESFYFPLEDQKSGLGYDHYIYNGRERMRGVVWNTGIWVASFSELPKKIIAKKQNALESLSQEYALSPQIVLR